MDEPHVHTLAAADPKPLTIGIGFTSLRLKTIRPQQYDVPMDYIVTEAETIRRPVEESLGVSSGTRASDTTDVE